MGWRNAGGLARSDHPSVSRGARGVPASDAGTLEGHSLIGSNDASGPSIPGAVQGAIGSGPTGATDQAITITATSTAMATASRIQIHGTCTDDPRSSLPFAPGEILPVDRQQQDGLIVTGRPRRPE
jgi:hypothetical protein